jgi:hypothetical protein
MMLSRAYVVDCPIVGFRSEERTHSSTSPSTTPKTTTLSSPFSNEHLTDMQSYNLAIRIRSEGEALARICDTVCKLRDEELIYVESQARRKHL